MGKNQKQQLNIKFMYNNIRIYINEAKNNIGFTALTSGYEPTETPKQTIKAVLHKTEIGNELFYSFKTKAHIKKGAFRHLGAKLKYIVLFFPQRRRFMFKGEVNNTFADVLSVNLKEFDFSGAQAKVREHQNTLNSFKPCQ